MTESATYDARGWPRVGECSRLYLEHMNRCAAFLGRELEPIKPPNFARRLDEADAALVLKGQETGVIVFEGNYLRTRDPHPTHGVARGG